MLTITAPAKTGSQHRAGLARHRTRLPNAAAPLRVGAAHSEPGYTTPERDGALFYIGAGVLPRPEGDELDAVTVPDGHVQLLLKATA